MFHKDKEHQFPDQTEVKKEERLRWGWVNVSFGFLLCFRGTKYITSIGLFYKKVGRLWRVSDCEELAGLLTGDDVNDPTRQVNQFPFVLLLVVLLILPLLEIYIHYLF